MDKELFEKSFLWKTVRAKGEYFQAIPPGEYFCTAALFEFDPGDVTILALMHYTYSKDNPQWYTVKIAKDEFKDAIRDFEVLD